MEEKTVVILPTYNEIENIPILIPQILTHLPETYVLVVDDNSPDGTADSVRTLMKENDKILLIVRPEKDGYGGACKEGYMYALKNGFTHILQMDSDFSHPPEVLPALLEQLRENDVVLASRYIEGGGVSGWGLFRRLLSKTANTFARKSLKLPYHDLTGGFRGFRNHVLEDLSKEFDNIESVGYVFLIEMNFRSHLKGYSFAEVPFIFPDRVRGESKMSGRIIFEAVRQILRLRRERQKQECVR